MIIKCKIIRTTIDYIDMTKYSIAPPEITLKIIESVITPEMLKILREASTMSSYIEIDLDDIKNHRNYFV